ncbi:unnamed protein product [Paramecium sonneborni]|uniref:Transmembrane protein n=1 Tax=Paramecium sonneborni TaxID=65129 RepID=A0A8S1RKU5_9CILI|nr:unnamed protein product [Paramecium sonneborni]
MSKEQELPIYNQQTPSLLSQISKVQYPIILSNVIPAAQYIQLDDVQQAVAEKIVAINANNDRQGFLIEYYKNILIQHSIIFGLFLLGLTQLLEVNSDGLGLWFQAYQLSQKYRFIVSKQTQLFYFQTVLIAFLLIGIAGYQRGNIFSRRVDLWIILVLTILIVLDLIQIVIVRTQKITILMKFTIMESFILNFILGLSNRYLDDGFAISEFIIIYFNQLNQQLLKQTHEVPEELSLIDKIKQLLEKIKQLNNYKILICNQQTFDNYYCIRNWISYSINIKYYYWKWLFDIHLDFRINFNTRCDTRNISCLKSNDQILYFYYSLKQEDSKFAVCLTYLDMAISLRLLLRNLYNN